MQHLKDVLIDIGYTPQESDRELNDLFKRHDQKWFTHIDRDESYIDDCVNKEQYIFLLQDIYNFKQSQKVNLMYN